MQSERLAKPSKLSRSETTETSERTKTKRIPNAKQLKTMAAAALR